MQISNKFNFVILGAHGSGLNAIYSYLNSISDIKCAYYGVRSISEIKEFLHQYHDYKKGIVIDSTNLIKTGALQYIINNTSDDCLLIITSRDPVARLKSVVNHHIDYWANTATGIYDLDIKKTLLYSYGNINHLISKLIATANMNTVSELCGNIASYFHKTLPLDISRLHPDKITNTISQIYFIIDGGLRERERERERKKEIPTTLSFSKENRFIKYIRKLNISIDGDNYDLIPCPVELLSSYGYADAERILIYRKDEIPFTLGNFNGDIAFILTTKIDTNHDQIISEIKNKLINNPALIDAYCSDISLRYTLATSISTNLFVDNNKLIQYIQENDDNHSKLANFIDSQYSVMKKIDPESIKMWHDSEVILQNLN